MISLSQIRHRQTARIHSRHVRGTDKRILPDVEYHLPRYMERFCGPSPPRVFYGSTANVHVSLPSGNSTWAGATAAITANVVLIAYVIVAMREDEGDQKVAQEKARKAQ